MKFLIIFVSICLFQGQIYAQTKGETWYVKDKYSVKAKAYEKNNEIIAKVYPNDPVEIIFLEENLAATNEEDSYWAKIRVDKKEGYIPLKFLQKERLAAKMVKAYVRERYEPKKYYVTASSLYVREEPERNANVITSLSRKSEVTVTKYSDSDDYIDGVSAKWAFVQTTNDLEGWVFSGYLSEDSSESEEKDKEDPLHIYSGSKKYVKARLLHVRDEPSKFGTTIGVLPSNSSVKILERSKQQESLAGIRSIWVKVQADDYTGWVYGGFLSENKTSRPMSDNLDKPFIYPLGTENETRMTSTYGIRVDPVTGKQGTNHTGVDLITFVGIGSPIYAAGDGVVLQLNTKTSYGNLTIIRHDNGLYTYYAHQNQYLVKEGDRVKAGDLIGKMGTTGKSTGPHLHFEVRTGIWEETMNPLNYITVPNQ